MNECSSHLLLLEEEATLSNLTLTYSLVFARLAIQINTGELLQANERDGSRTKSSGGCSWHRGLAALVAHPPSTAQLTSQTKPARAMAVSGQDPCVWALPRGSDSTESLNRKFNPALQTLVLFEQPLLTEGDWNMMAILLVWPEPEVRAQKTKCCSS